MKAVGAAGLGGADDPKFDLEVEIGGVGWMISSYFIPSHGIFRDFRRCPFVQGAPPHGGPMASPHPLDPGRKPRSLRLLTWRGAMDHPGSISVH